MVDDYQSGIEGKERTGYPARFIWLRRQLQLKLFESPMMVFEY
jgi:hypothetical protein